MGHELPELDCARDLGDLLTVAFNLFVRHFSPLFTLAMIPVIPYTLLIDGVWGRALANGADAKPEAAPTATYLVVGALVIQPLVTALVVRYLETLRAGREPTVGGALRDGLPLLLPAAGAILLAAIGITAGLFLLIVPGIWLAVRWLFVAQAVVIDGARGTQALRHSAAVVDGQWWSTFGRLIVLNLVGTAIALVLGIPAAAIDNGVVYTVLQTIATAASIAFGALAMTLLFFDRRRRAAGIASAP